MLSNDVEKSSSICCIKSLKIVLDLMHLKNDCMGALIYHHLIMEIETGTVITFLFIQMVHMMGILWLMLQFFHQTPVIPMRLPDSPSVFNAKIFFRLARSLNGAV